MWLRLSTTKIFINGELFRRSKRSNSICLHVYRVPMWWYTMDTSLLNRMTDSGPNPFCNLSYHKVMSDNNFSERCLWKVYPVSVQNSFELFEAKSEPSCLASSHRETSRQRQQWNKCVSQLVWLFQSSKHCNLGGIVLWHDQCFSTLMQLQRLRARANEHQIGQMKVNSKCLYDLIYKMLNTLI